VALTRRHHLEDARLQLASDVVAAPALQRAVVSLRDDRVAERTGDVSVADPVLGHFVVLARVVEHPQELDVAGVGRHFALDAQLLIERAADHHYVLRVAHWCVCNTPFRTTNLQSYKKTIEFIANGNFFLPLVS
jgi:hypothetical protein